MYYTLKIQDTPKKFSTQHWPGAWPSSRASALGSLRPSPLSHPKQVLGSHRTPLPLPTQTTPAPREGDSRPAAPRALGRPPGRCPPRTRAGAGRVSRGLPSDRQTFQASTLGVSGAEDPGERRTSAPRGGSPPRRSCPARPRDPGSDQNRAHRGAQGRGGQGTSPPSRRHPAPRSGDSFRPAPARSPAPQAGSPRGRRSAPGRRGRGRSRGPAPLGAQPPLTHPAAAAASGLTTSARPLGYGARPGPNLAPPRTRGGRRRPPPGGPFGHLPPARSRPLHRSTARTPHCFRPLPAQEERLAKPCRSTAS